MAMVSTRTVEVNGKTITYQLERKAVKNVNLRIRKDGTVCVSARSNVSAAWVDAFVVRHGEYILSAQEKYRQAAQNIKTEKWYVSGDVFYIQGRGVPLDVAEGAKDEVWFDGSCIYLRLKDPLDLEKRKRYVDRCLDKQCMLVFTEILDKYYPRFRAMGVAYPELKIRKMKSCWGSCVKAKGLITLNKELLGAPRSCIEYVVMHELCHLIHPNHSDRYYELLTKMMPDWKERKARLNSTSAGWFS